MIEADEGRRRGSVPADLRVHGTPAIVQQLSYDEWGVQTVELGSTTLHPFGFAGGIRMGFAGLWHFGARNYDTAIGQWIEKDPIEYAGCTGPYLYCENDPVNRSIQVLEEQIANGGHIHFDLTHMSELADVLRGTGRFAETTTAQELRHIMTNWDRFRFFVTFYVRGVEVAAPW